ncbi:MAG: hypothetical protein JXM70_02370 [Pirellulales bacterium]|nr:hypothetical protein [Pirellulales bacterium]
MENTKEKLRAGEVALGGWIMMGHPSIAEIMAGEGFDWLCVDMEHTDNTIRDFHHIALALKGTGCDLLARLPACNPSMAKLVLDAGASGIIVPSVNTPEEADRAVKMARFPPEGTRGTALCRASDFGRNFPEYFNEHNGKSLVVVMIEHIQAVEHVEAILATPGVDAALIGPYDLSASMELPGQLDHAHVLTAQQAILTACKAAGVPAGIHVVHVNSDEIERRIGQGYRFIACGLDTEFIMYGCRTMLKGR